MFTALQLSGYCRINDQQNKHANQKKKKQNINKTTTKSKYVSALEKIYSFLSIPIPQQVTNQKNEIVCECDSTDRDNDQGVTNGIGEMTKAE